jgi:hypothetical protein
MLEWQINKIRLENFVNIMKLIPNKDHTYHVHGSFGDVYFQLSALKELLEEKKESFNILIDQKYENLANDALGMSITKYYTTGGNINILFNDLGIVGKIGNLPIRLLPTIYPGCAELILAQRLYYSDFLRGIIGSSRTGVFSKIENVNNKKIKAQEIIKSSGCEPGNTLLLSIDNNTHKEFSEDFWIFIINIIKKHDVSVLLNDSGTLSYESANLLSNTDLPRIKIPPELVVTIPSIAGGYIGGTNGFSTIQALFNDNVNGLHMINALESSAGKLKDKFENEYKEDALFHAKAWRETFRNKQTELLINKYTKENEIENLLNKYLKFNFKNKIN